MTTNTLTTPRIDAFWRNEIFLGRHRAGPAEGIILPGYNFAKSESVSKNFQKKVPTVVAKCTFLFRKKGYLPWKQNARYY